MSRRPPSWLRPLSLLLAAVALLPPAPAGAQPLEQSVKAAFLPKFARYVGWPSHARPAAGQPIVLCVIGDDPFGRVLDQAVAGQRIDQNPFAVRRLSTTDRASGCHIAFLRGSSAQTTSQMLIALRPLPVLTVTDAKFGSDRGMIHFAINQRRVGFHIDEAAAARSNLAVSSRLLGLAISVRGRR